MSRRKPPEVEPTIILTTKQYADILFRLDDLEKWHQEMYQREVEQLALESASELEARPLLWWLPRRAK